MSLILDENVNEDTIKQLIKFVDNKEYVLDSKYISKEQILQEEMESLGHDPLELLGYNPYEAIVELIVKDTKEIYAYEEDLKKNKNIAEIIYHKNNDNENIDVATEPTTNDNLSFKQIAEEEIERLNVVCSGCAKLTLTVATTEPSS